MSSTSSSASGTATKTVFAHMIVGNTASMAYNDWKNDITLAKAAGIDGFALNIGGDPYTAGSLVNAYTAAIEVGEFKMFISFDYAAHTFSQSDAITIINTYNFYSSQYRVSGKPLVSTFEGPANQGDWATIRASTNCFFIPDWSSIGPTPAYPVSLVDGALSWDAWPVGAADKTTDVDVAYRNILGTKPYMMPVSPWFYTNLPAYGKNWTWRGDSLWHQRWQQVIELQPEFVQILSWNDFGESHYIGPIYESAVVAEATKYVNNMVHDHWRDVLPYYIAAYKSNNTTIPSVTQEKLIYWYRINPNDASGCSPGTTGNAPWQPTTNPALVATNKVFLSALLSFPATITVQIGSVVTTLSATTVGVNHFSVPYDTSSLGTGVVKFTMTRNGQIISSTTGPTITTNCVSGIINWNAIVGSS
ncbi:MAG: hypothetical protein M1834_004595 [Cirrosporium novae-zelandiae]|nr:MAG: hypothetical protein M1834_004595 [Cirrosporium novae-zelandiae]